MSHLTAEELIAAASAQLDRAKLEVQRLEGHLNWLRSLAEQTSPAAQTEEEGETKSVQPQATSATLSLPAQTAGGQVTALRQATLAMMGEFTAPMVVNKVLPHFPRIGYDKLMRLESALLYRLHKRGLLEKMAEGSGRIPNAYRVVRR